MYNRGVEFNITSRNIIKNNLAGPPILTLAHSSKQSYGAGARQFRYLRCNIRIETCKRYEGRLHTGFYFCCSGDGVKPSQRSAYIINRFGKQVQYNQVGTPSKWTYLDVPRLLLLTARWMAVCRQIYPYLLWRLNNTFTYKALILISVSPSLVVTRYITVQQATFRDQRFWNNETGILNRWTNPWPGNRYPESGIRR